jgi:uncharacterized protein (TIGR02217 family)
VKHYASGSQSSTRAIAKPVTGTVRIAIGGVDEVSGWSVDTATGVVSFGAAPGSGVAITAGFEFDVPVRFDTDVLDVTLDLERLGSITSIRFWNCADEDLRPLPAGSARARPRSPGAGGSPAPMA